MTEHVLPWYVDGRSGPAIHCGFPPTGPGYSMAASVPAPSASDDDGWEADCIRETQQGRPEAFNPLVSRYAPRIRAYLYRMVRNQEEAEDLTQETFIKAFRNLSRFDAERPFRSWLYTIATNTGLNALRSRKRRGTPVELDAERVASPGTVVERPAAYGMGREEALELALAQLTERAARLVALHYQEGFSLAEAGTMMGLTENAAKVAVCRARKQLRKIMLEGQPHEL